MGKKKIEIIPAIDIIDGKCVRLSQGDYDSKKEYDKDPLELAKRFETYGIKRLHIVDLDGARSKHIVNHKIVEKIAEYTSLTIDFGGGIKSDEDIDLAFASGASMVTVGSVAVNNPPLFEKWLDKYGSYKIILGADIRDNKVCINGWKEDMNNELMPFLDKYTAKGIDNILCTDISRDGMLKGPSTDLYTSIMKRFPDIHLIASGGVSCIDDIQELQDNGIPAVVFGKAIYEGKIELEELVPFLED